MTDDLWIGSVDGERLQDRRREPQGKGSLRGLVGLLVLAWSALGAVGAVLLWGLL